MDSISLLIPVCSFMSYSILAFLLSYFLVISLFQISRVSSFLLQVYTVYFALATHDLNKILLFLF